MNKFEELNNRLNKKCSDIDKLKEYNNYNDNMLDDIVATVNSLIEASNFQSEYIEALRFILWFRWKYIKSEILKNEARMKPIKDLDYSQSCRSAVIIKLDYDNIPSRRINNKGKDHKYSNLNTICIDGRNTAICATTDWYKSYSPVFTPATIEEPKKIIITFDETVAGLIAKPYKYSKPEIYSVYKYLLEILDKDAIANKYYY